jgi:hypothetical protein
MKKVIFLKERNISMLEEDLIIRNPIHPLGHAGDDILPEGGFGAILACAGVGKTAILVQIALETLFDKKNVLHVSLKDPVDKVCLWYEEVFRNLADRSGRKTDRPWETILQHRLIMTFKAEGFTVPRLEERLTDLTEQSIFFPQMMLIDGFPFEEESRHSLEALKNLARANGIRVWMAVRTHRHEQPADDGFPPFFSRVADLFEAAYQLEPDEREIRVRLLKGGDPRTDFPELLLDPSTLLIRGRKAS